MKQVFYVPQWEWKPNIKHYCKLDDLWTGFKVAERYRIGHVTEVNFQDAVGQGGLFWQSRSLYSGAVSKKCLQKSSKAFPSFPSAIMELMNSSNEAIWRYHKDISKRLNIISEIYSCLCVWEIFLGKILVREHDSSLIMLSRMACEVLSLALKSDWGPC